MNNKSNNIVSRRRKSKYRKTVVLVQKILLLIFLLLLIIMCTILIFSKLNSLLNTDSTLSVKGQTIDLRNDNQSNIQSQSTDTIPQRISDLPWYLTLINSENPIDDNYQITLTRLRNKQAIDSRCYPELQSMMDDCRAAGLSPIICSSYRTYEKQQDLFEQQVQEFINQGYGKSDAQKKAAGAVARPGTSEHELGLAVDIVDENNQRLNQYQENTAVQRWLMQNSWRYGFILRYPSDKTDITGIQYEPWHYRFVGKEAAKEIYENNWTLEEYLNQICFCTTYDISRITY